MLKVVPVQNYYAHHQNQTDQYDHGAIKSIEYLRHIDEDYF